MPRPRFALLLASATMLACADRSAPAPDAAAAADSAAPAVAVTATPDAAAVDDSADFAQALDVYLRAQAIDPGYAFPKIARIDLNGDGRRDAMALITGRDFCTPDGCQLLLFESTAQSWRYIERIRNVKGPIVVTDERTNGFRDLALRIPGAGGIAVTVQLRYNGELYPMDPSLAPRYPAERVPKGDVVLNP
ncbi:MAG: hypothetical protein K2X99_02425 [Gemmatimonadaceae bacterium]|nr:hypothetical protein [Gemmatimonadaceae bacterium]